MIYSSNMLPVLSMGIKRLSLVLYGGCISSPMCSVYFAPIFWNSLSFCPSITTFVLVLNFNATGFFRTLFSPSARSNTHKKPKPPFLSSVEHENQGKISNISRCFDLIHFEQKDFFYLEEVLGAKREWVSINNTEFNCSFCRWKKMYMPKDKFSSLEEQRLVNVRSKTVSNILRII